MPEERVEPPFSSRRRERPEAKRLPCSETFTLGPFLFECVGHYFGAREYALLHQNGVMEHWSTSPGQPGDCDLTWYTEVIDDDE